MKYKRQNKIINIISTKEIQTQEMLLEELLNEGFRVTQATVSRDIKELGLIKIPVQGNIYKYAVADANRLESEKHISMFSDAVVSIDFALHTVVVKTFPGMAPAVAASVDSAMKTEILGSVAGDDTVLIIAENGEKARVVAQKLDKIFRLR
ncbi:MAG: arginine repressor [Clostridia bacterium]|nr:arginine repressor [Clostridia bacterium]